MKFRKGDLVRLKVMVAFAQQLPEVYLVEGIHYLRYIDKDETYPAIVIRGNYSDPHFFELVTSILREDA